MRPVPAALYLGVAVAAVVLLLAVGLGGRREPSLDQGTPAHTPLSSGIGGPLAAVSILPNETVSFRDPGGADGPAVVIAADQPLFLLLELMDLEEAPPDDEAFGVSVAREGSSDVVLTATVLGKAIQDSYTICLPIAAHTLEPGIYTISVSDPGGNRIYEAHLSAR